LGVTIQQIAALPYRATSDALDASVSVLLVTSMETKRWVLPKGNLVKGLSAHASAAVEAEEEGGVRGAACPTPIGSYRYRKKRANGASLMVNVEVFPVAVIDELGEWKERHQRERRWFSLVEAANAVDEPDLKDIIRAFNASDVSRVIKAGPLVGVRRNGRGVAPFRWFQALLPRQGNFFDLFEAHAVAVNAGSDALARLLRGGSGMQDHVREIMEREKEADAVIREIMLTVRRTFLTPFDRGAIIGLISAMDDAIDEMQETARAISLYEVKDFDQQMNDMAAIIVDCARLISEALPLLRDISRNAARLHELTERLTRMENDADDIQAAGLKEAFKAHGQGNAIRFIVSREIYGHLERVVNRFEDVADEIDGLVIDHA